MLFIKNILFYLLLFMTSSITAQEYYSVDKKIMTKPDFNSFLLKTDKDAKEQDKNLKGTKLIFLKNKIIERNDSIITYCKIFRVNKEYQEDNITKHLNKPLPEMSLERYTGGQFVNMHLGDKPTVIAIFYYNNSKSRWFDELYQLNAIEEKYRGKVNFIGLTKNDRTKVTQLLLNTSFNYTILINAKNYLEKLDSRCSPKLLVIDKNGIIRYITSNMPPVVDTPEENRKAHNNFMNEIEELLK